ncbi:MAG: hypothetical protein ACE5HB_10570 [Terriglobia bacterium]
MMLQLRETAMIENLRHYPHQTVQALRGLLAAGALAQADPRRKHFYELENGSEVFYIHLTPRTRRVLLLATWRKDCPQAT